ncbi:hypothetical protein NPIRD3C_2088 [Nitrosopumilus piranensis]|uniref:Uncharacterized protein n=1 Tax=Nitrosopumilus piranensis TaxID=1582439 RepID=A0A0C5BU55_9ARCH|nr:hypothetical protein NPIRD3C_2088 [Nitrosopumilus piranensis]
MQEKIKAANVSQPFECKVIIINKDQTIYEDKVS